MGGKLEFAASFFCLLASAATRLLLEPDTGAGTALELFIALKSIAFHFFTAEHLLTPSAAHVGASAAACTNCGFEIAAW